MRPVSVVGIGQIPVVKNTQDGLRVMAAQAINKALEDAGIERVDALYASNMLGDELQSQKHFASLIADEAGLAGVEALHIRAATAGGAAALRVGYLAVASGEAETVLIVGAEKMSQGSATPALAKALDAEIELPAGSTLLSKVACLHQRYFDQYHPPEEALAYFSVNAHVNARHNPNALYQDRQFSIDDVMSSRLITPPIRLLDCSPICDGAAAVVLAPTSAAALYSSNPIKLVGSAAATDRFRMADRQNPLSLVAAHLSGQKALAQSGLQSRDISFFEVHDAFSIMACLALETMGFAKVGEGWRLAAEGRIGLDGDIPICTLGGLKARGHPIGATALYQVCEIVLQLTGRAGQGQVPDAQVALMQSIGGAASTIITHLFTV